MLDRERVLADNEGDIRRARASDLEVPNTVGLSFFEADAGFEPVSVDTRGPWDSVQRPSQNEVPVVLTRGEAKQAADRWLSEAQTSRETCAFALPPSRSDVCAGDLVAFEDAPQDIYRVERVTVAEGREVEAVRVDPTVYTPAPEIAEIPITAPYVPPLPAICLPMELPLLRGDEAAHAPYLAASGDPWPGGVNVYSSRTDAGYTLATTLDAPATLGQLDTALPFAPIGAEQRGVSIEVTLVSGDLYSVDEAAFLSGANLAAIGSGAADGWELIQFRKAEPLGGRRYRLSGFLRGQAGTDWTQAGAWPKGSYFVLVDGALDQLDLPAESLNLPMYLRSGPAGRPYDDRSYSTEEVTFVGRGLAPYRPCHLACTRLGGDHHLSWVRRTRIGGDDWSREDVPLAETIEAYVLRVFAQGSLVREERLTEPQFTYTSAQRSSDGVVGGYRIEVAQISDLFGAGPSAALNID
jgi:hypothetical protein